MRDFFKGWRRKAGVVTLGMACYLCVTLILSFGVYSQYWYVAGTSQYRVASLNGVLVWQWWDRGKVVANGIGGDDGFDSVQYAPKVWQVIDGDPLKVLMSPDKSTLSIRYDLVIAALALLAYLLLRPQRKRPQTSTTIQSPQE